jgi:NTE family protein
LPSETDVFCVFEGGGAKGVAHVGFLRAIDKQSTYTAKGYAGTSAGAIIAALAAAGWTGRELFDHATVPPQSAALKYLNESCGAKISNLSDILDKKDWSRLRRIKELLNSANIQDSNDPAEDIGEIFRRYCIIYLRIVGLIFALAAILSVIPIGFVNYLSSALWILLFFALAPALPATVALMYFASRFSGIASLDRAQGLIESLLRYKVGGPSDSPVTFAEIHNKTGHSLKIVAADIENGNLKLFSTDTTPSLSVAAAVAASAAIPILFKPILVDGRQYCDGGIVSNLPAWTFDSERLNNEDCLIVTCAVSPPRDLKISRPKLRGLRLFTRVAVTALFGGSDLNTRGLLRHLPLGAWHSIRMLDFERSSEQMELIQTSEEQGDIKMDLERSHRLSIDALRAEIRELLGRRGNHDCSLRVAYVRHVNLVDAPPAGYHLWNCAGFEGYADRGITLPATGSLLGDCMSELTPRWYDLQQSAVRERHRNVSSGRLADRLPSDRAWVAIVPLVESRVHGRVSVAVCVDCDAHIDDGETSFLPEICGLVRKYT